MKLTRNTRISEILRFKPEALEAIVGIHPHFKKLRNPVLRKLMAGRVSVEQAAKIGGCTVDDFFRALAPLGFIIEEEISPDAGEEINIEKPAWLSTGHTAQAKTLDVRPFIDRNEDPLERILHFLKNVKLHEVCCIINSFEPVPLIRLLAHQGFTSYVEVQEGQVNTWLYRLSWPEKKKDEPGQPIQNSFEDAKKKFMGKMKEIDVRAMEMPQPMLTILGELDALPDDTALYVHHKRVPVYLLPELEEKGFGYFIDEKENGEVNLIIYHAK